MFTGTFIVRTFYQSMLPFRWRTLKGKHCHRPIAKIGFTHAWTCLQNNETSFKF